MSAKNIVVLVSGGGTNLQALIDAQQAGILHSGEISLVISDKPGVKALERAEKAGISEKSVSANGRYIRVKPNLHYRSAIELRIDVQQQKEIDGSHEVVVSVSDDRGINLTVRKQEG